MISWLHRDVIPTASSRLWIGVALGRCGLRWRDLRWEAVPSRLFTDPGTRMIPHPCNAARPPAAGSGESVWHGWKVSVHLGLRAANGRGDG
jgi:hypothetical protein